MFSSGDLHLPNSCLKHQFAQVLKLRWFTLKDWKPLESKGAKGQTTNYATLCLCCTWHCSAARGDGLRSADYCGSAVLFPFPGKNHMKTNLEGSNLSSTHWTPKQDLYICSELWDY